MVIRVAGITGILVLKSVAGIIEKLSSFTFNGESHGAAQVYAKLLSQTLGIYYSNPVVKSLCHIEQSTVGR